MHFCASLHLGLPMLVTAATQLGAEKGSVYGTPVRGVSAVSARCLRGVSSATYVRVNHWADFDESYSDGKRSAAATPWSNSGGSQPAPCLSAFEKREAESALEDDSGGR